MINELIARNPQLTQWLLLAALAILEIAALWLFYRAGRLHERLKTRRLKS
jgi:hypothetical protein